jgi:hypothetical protein
MLNEHPKVISFPIGHFGRNRQPPLSELMIATLLAACEKQAKKIPFGPKEVGHSFTVLIKRGLIVSKQITTDGQPQSTWQVTDEAIQMLRALGIEIPFSKKD